MNSSLQKPESKRLSEVFLALLSVILFWCGGITPALLVTGYIVVKEKDEWLWFMALRAAILWLLAEIIAWVINVIPTFISFINDICYVFDGSGIYVPFISKTGTVLLSGLEIFTDIVYLLMVVGILLSEFNLSIDKARRNYIKPGFLDSLTYKVLGIQKELFLKTHSGTARMNVEPMSCQNGQQAIKDGTSAVNDTPVFTGSAVFTGAVDCPNLDMYYKSREIGKPQSSAPEGNAESEDSSFDLFSN